MKIWFFDIYAAASGSHMITLPISRLGSSLSARWGPCNQLDRAVMRRDDAEAQARSTPR